MFWKIALVLGLLGFIVGLAIFAISLRVLTTTTDSTAQDFALGFFLFSILLTLGALVLALVAVVFVLRASKKAFEADKAK